ncbi:MAG: hypothetical protein GXO24_01580 [Chlorobi bacterium]|nr:hypothetical protein [Chlorobiota bacterium]
MKKIAIILTFIALFSGLNVSAQQNPRYEPGYVIDQNGQTLRVEILNKDWAYTPEKITYRFQGKKKVATPGNVKAVGIPNKWKYISATVDVDTVPDLVNRLSKRRNPDWAHKTIFLKVLVDGKADLFLYKKPNMNRFFYRIDNGPIKPLIHRRYFVFNEKEKIYNKIAVNNDYKQTLYNAFKCPGMSRKKFEALNYTVEDLKKIFREYNRCKKESYRSFNTYSSPGILNVNVTARGDMFRMHIKHAQKNLDNQTASQGMGGGLGVTVEYVLPFAHNMWSLFTEPALRIGHQNLSFEKENTITSETEKYLWEYKNLSLDIPLGIRMYFIRNEGFNAFGELAFVLNADLGSELIQYKNDELDQTLKPKSKSYWEGGVGMSAGRLSAILRYYYNANMIANYHLYSSPYNGFALVIGYRIWKKENYW